jgi:hypothetical protein
MSWIVDSEAFKHMTPHSIMFKTYKPMSGRDKVQKNVVVASEDGIEDTMELSDTMDVSTNTSLNSRLNSSMN